MRTLAIAAALITLAVGPALAQAPPAGTPTRIRGTVDKLDGRNLTVKTREGPAATVTFADNFTVRAVAKKSLADIKAGDYVGAASTKDTDGKLHALEVLMLPEAARGTSEGQAPWDLTPDSLMTNATVSGIVAGPGGQVLKLSYKGNESEVLVGPDVPIVSIVAGDPSLLKPGAAVIISALKKPDSSLTAAGVVAEKDGVKPPM